MTEHRILAGEPPPVSPFVPSETTLPAPTPGLLPEWLRLALVGLALLSLFTPSFLFADNPFRIELFNRCFALAVMALGVDLIWGYTGVLSLGQGLYFGIGAYAVAYSLKLKQAALDANAVSGLNAAPGTIPPDFMNYTGLAPTHPDYVEPAAMALIAPLANIWLAVAVAIVLPAALAALFSMVAFWRRIGGVYFALLTQALVLATFLLVDNQQPFTGGRPGINGVAHLELFGFTFNRYRNGQQMSWMILGVLLVCFLALAWLLRTKFGKILTAIRDNENRVLALGYNTALYKVFAFTLAGALAGLGGALFMAVNDKMGPTYMGVGKSIEFVVFVAVGGRGTLLGAILGTILVEYGTSYLAELNVDLGFVKLGGKELRFVVIGLLFVGVVLFMPRGILGSLRSLMGWLKKKWQPAEARVV